MALMRRSGRRKGPASLEDEIVLYHADDKMRFAHGSYELVRKPESGIRHPIDGAVPLARRTQNRLDKLDERQLALSAEESRWP